MFALAFFTTAFASVDSDWIALLSFSHSLFVDLQSGQAAVNVGDQLDDMDVDGNAENRGGDGSENGDQSQDDEKEDSESDAEVDLESDANWNGMRTLQHQIFPGRVQNFEAESVMTGLHAINQMGNAAKEYKESHPERCNSFGIVYAEMFQDFFREEYGRSSHYLNQLMRHTLLQDFDWNNTQTQSRNILMQLGYFKKDSTVLNRQKQSLNIWTSLYLMAEFGFKKLAEKKAAEGALDINSAVSYLNLSNLNAFFKAATIVHKHKGVIARLNYSFFSAFNAIRYQFPAVLMGMSDPRAAMKEPKFNSTPQSNTGAIMHIIHRLFNDIARHRRDGFPFPIVAEDSSNLYVAFKTMRHSIELMDQRSGSSQLIINVHGPPWLVDPNGDDQDSTTVSERSGDIDDFDTE